MKHWYQNLFYHLLPKSEQASNGYYEQESVTLSTGFMLDLREVLYSSQNRWVIFSISSPVHGFGVEMGRKLFKAFCLGRI